MDLPQPPQDTELRNIIDKLAQFVARNGPEFEQMTKSKQKGNPKFQFLYGGEYFNYYTYKVTTEQALLRQQGILTTAPPQSWASQIAPSTTVVPNNTNPTTSIEHIVQQQETLKEQILQSEQNLTAQHTVLMQQQQAQIEATVAKFEMDALQNDANECDIDLNEFNSVLQPIVDSCTKDSISNGKSWILSHATNEKQNDCIAQCLLLKVIQGTVPFSQKLHIIYLVNDVLHHCARKHADELKKSLENVVVPMFCNASVGASDEQRNNKLEKLLKLWESKANYLAASTVDKLRQPNASYQLYQAQQLAKYAGEVATLTQQTKATFDGYQSQHQAFISHAMQQIMSLQQQKQTMEPQQVTQLPTGLPQPQPPPLVLHDGMNPPPPTPLPIQQPLTPNNIQHISGPLQPPPATTAPQNAMATTDSYMPSESYMPPINPSVPPPLLGQPPNGLEHTMPFTQPPPPVFLPGGFPDFSKPPPGFPMPLKPELVVEDLMPSVPYYDLPAGLMIPLIRLEEMSYKPLDPQAIRLPPPAPPSDRLLAAVEAFYAIPSHDRPRDSEGWEKLGLYEYYKAKNNAKRQKEEQIRLGLREKSRSPSPVVLPTTKSPSPPKRRYQSKSPSPVKRSRSRSPVRMRRRSKSKRRRSVSRSRSRSPPAHAMNRSPTPPSFMSPFMKADTQELDESNKGHQMLKKMGWSGSGSGLGAKEQGIDAPISGGDVRDRHDQFKGVGMNLNDPYENFRKHKGAAFITRMKARAEERAQESKGLTRSNSSAPQE